MLPVESWSIGFDQRSPIYQQIIDRFSQSLVRGSLSPGERIPSIRDLAIELKVNTNTVQRAYQEMERNEMIYSKRGTGYFVMNDSNLPIRVKRTMVRDTTSRFLQEMYALGFSGEDIVTEIDRQIHGEETEHGTDDNKGS
ncbi:MAG: GntR family transcriptional regulator [Oscillospiraceae bacterium]|nr:GntR family transcriptional regulator [Oscillospiraceae bacterium]